MGLDRFPAAPTACAVGFIFAPLRGYEAPVLLVGLSLQDEFSCTLLEPMSFCYYSSMGVPRAGSDYESLALAAGQLQTGTMRKSFA